MKGGGHKCRSGRVAKLLGNVDEHVHCDIGTVRLELRDQVNKEGGKEGGEKTILGRISSHIVMSINTYKNEHGVSQISPLDLSDVVVHCGHLVIVFPYRLLIPKRL